MRTPLLLLQLHTALAFNGYLAMARDAKFTAKFATPGRLQTIFKAVNVDDEAVRARIGAVQQTRDAHNKRLRLNRHVI